MNKIAILLSCAVSYAAYAEPTKLLEELKAVLKSTKEESSKAGQQREFSGEFQLEMLLSATSNDDQIGEDNLPSLIRALKQISNVSNSKKAVQISRDLLAELSSQQEAKAKTMESRFDKTIRSALAKGLDAKNAEDLDAPLTELAALTKDIYAYSSRGDEPMRNYASRADRLHNLLTAIQDGFLTKTNSKFLSRNNNSWDQIVSFADISNEPLGSYITRSELIRKLHEVIDRIAKTFPGKVLTRYDFDKQIQSWVNEVKTLDDLEQTMFKIDELIAHQREYGGNTGDTNLVEELRSCRRIYNDFQAGIGTSLNFANRSSSQATDILSGVKNKLLLFALPRVLLLGEQLPPEKEDTVNSYLNRVFNHARDTSDWQLVLRVLDAANNAGVTSLGDTENYIAFRQFLAGLRLEQAHQYSTAVVSYLAFLKSGSDVIPAEKIGAILDAIKKEHPEDYENGVAIAEMPKDIRNGRNMSGGPRSSSTISIPAKPKSSPGPKSQEAQTISPDSKAETPKADVPTKDSPINK